MLTKPKTEASLGGGFEGFVLISKSLTWIGASAGAVTLCCTLFGFVVKHTLLDRLGVPRSVFEPTSTEYVVTGAKSLAGVIPLALYGAVEFLWQCWWLLLLIAVFAVALWKRRWPPEIRVLGAAAIYGLWLLMMLLRLIEFSPPDAEGLDIFAFGTIAGVLYCCIEIFLGARSFEARPVSIWMARLPLYALVFSAVFALPYLKGLHGTVQSYPLIQFLGKDRDYFCGLAQEGSAGDASKSTCAVYELIEQGRDRALLRKPPSSRIYVVSAASVAAANFVLLPADAQP
jgi:hypothetical protein